MARVERITIVPNSTYRFILQAAENELAELKGRLESIEKEKLAIEARMTLLEEMKTAARALGTDEEGEASPRLAEACFRVLGDAPMTVPEIKKALEAIGVRMSRYKNPLAVLHTTLDRMFASGTGQVQKFANKGKRPTFRRGR
jgi:hypothetical protein